MHITLRAYLTRPNVSLEIHPNANCSTARNDATSSKWPVVNEWDPWEDFDITNINTLLGTLLDTSFEVANPPPPLKSPRLLRHESHFDFVLVRQNNVIVNEALRVACSHLGLDQVEWTRGGNDTGDGTFPDWSGSTVSESDDQNLIPGDTKFTRNLLRPKRQPKGETRDSDGLPMSSPANGETSLVRSCLEQVNNYAAARKARYFYIITNQELFVCRRKGDPPLDSSIAAQRTKRPRLDSTVSTPTRQPQAINSSPPPLIACRNQRHVVSISQVTADLSSHPASPATPSSSNLFSDSIYQEDDAVDDTESPECVSIPWASEEGLTVNLGLFVIHLLALISNGIQTEYEPIHIDSEYCAKLKC